jgi:hypothetical protein
VPVYECEKLDAHMPLNKTASGACLRFGGMDVSEARRLEALEDENTRLKRLLADAMLDNSALKDLLGKKW